MNVYFACSITGGREDEAAYRALVDAMLADGHKVPTAMLANNDVISLEGTAEPDDVYRRDTEWISGCDALVAEVSTPSHGVGYEIGYALSRGKPVLCVYRQGVKVSKMITGNPDKLLEVQSYGSVEGAVKIVRGFLMGLDGGK